MNKDIKKTLERRREILYKKIDQIWKLEQEKARLRSKKQNVRKEIKSGKRQAGRVRSSSPYGTAAGSISTNQEIAKSTQDRINNLALEQTKFLEDIRDYIINI